VVRIAGGSEYWQSLQNLRGSAQNEAVVMKLIIRDTWIRHGDVEVGRGEDRLVFERCIFVGGTVKVAPEVDTKIFVHCLFQGTRFTAQSYCPRITVDCHWQAPNTEDACQRPAFLDGLGQG
jgi:hypothetical protein